MAVYKDLIESAQHSSKNNIAGQISFFQLNSDEMEKSGSAVRLPDISEFNKKILMTMEKEMLGVYISEHPLSDYESELQKICSVTSDNLMHAADSEEGIDGTENIDIGVYDGMKATMGGIITHRKQLTTKNGKQMAFITLEDIYGEAEGVIFPNIYEKYKPLIEEDKIVVIRGTINFKEDEIPKILADSVVDINTVINRTEAMVKIKIDGEKWNQVKNVLKAHQGNVPVIIYMDGRKSMKASRELWVEPTEEFRNEIEAIAGEGNIKC